MQFTHEHDPEWYEVSFTRFFLAWCITMLVLLAAMLENLPANAMIACAGLS